MNKTTTLPILPDKWLFEVKKETSKQYKIIKELMNDSRVTNLVCATDAGREGECIFRYVYNISGCKKPFERLWISSMEDSSILSGMNSLMPSEKYDSLFSSGLCRAKADWIVGMNATRLFSCRYGASLTVGRVQTPTLALIVNRDYDIEHFVKAKYYTVELDCNDFKLSSEKIDDEILAKNIAEMCDKNSATITSVVKEIKSVNPPKLYDMTTLQREANMRFGYTAQQTLDFTQALYEKKLCTYPRTDSQYLTEDMETTALTLVDTILSVFPEYRVMEFSPNVTRCLNSKKVSDHHAIIATSQIADFNLDTLPIGEKNILHLIVSKVLCASAPVHKYEAVKVTATCNGTQFKTSGKTIIEIGWKAFLNVLSQRKALDEESEQESVLPDLSENMSYIINSAQAIERFTKPPKQYNDATLLKAMETAGNADYDENSDTEKKGLGTTATRAAIIESLISKDFIRRDKKNLISTDKGRQLISVVPDDVKSPKLTADWETKLQAIERGEISDSTFMNEISNFVKTICSTYGTKADDSPFSKKAESIGNCPHCKGEITKGKFGYYCKNKCGMNVAKSFGKALSDSQLTSLLTGKSITITTSKGGKAKILPEAMPYEYIIKDGKTISGFQWKTEYEKTKGV